MPEFDTTPTDLHLPVICKAEARIGTSAKKGVSLGPGGCGLLTDLGISWYYSGRECPGVERVPYLDSAELLANVTEQQPPDAAYVMFLNECDLGHWRCPPLEEQVRLFIAAEAAWPGIIWVGPCSSGGVQYVKDFWRTYTLATGRKPDKATHRACVHCYGAATDCIARTEAMLATGAAFGIGQAWVTEFGLPLGLTRSINDVLAENAAFVAWMEDSPQVERYAYWAAKIAYYGHYVPSKPISGFHPLAFDWQEADGSIVERLTDMGEWFATQGGE